MIKVQYNAKQLQRLLWCPVEEVHYNPEDKELLLKIPQSCCVDMCGAIKYAESIDLEVKQIQTHYGDKLDACYVKVNGDWEHRSPVGFRKIHS